MTTFAPYPRSWAGKASASGPLPAKTIRRPGRIALRLDERLGAAGGDHARERPPGEGDRTVVRAGRDDDPRRADRRGRAPSSSEHDLGAVDRDGARPREQRRRRSARPVEQLAATEEVASELLGVA